MFTLCEVWTPLFLQQRLDYLVVGLLLPFILACKRQLGLVLIHYLHSIACVEHRIRSHGVSVVLSSGSLHFLYAPLLILLNLSLQHSVLFVYYVEITDELLDLELPWPPSIVLVVM